MASAAPIEAPGRECPRDPRRRDTCTPNEARDTEGEILALLLPELSRFLAAEVDGHAIDRDGLIPPSVRAGLARLGLFGMTIPEAYGGAGLSLGAACRVVAEIARVDRSVAIMVGLHAGLGTRGLVELGTPALRARWLPQLASGDCVASFAATEAGAGSALTAIATTGRLVDGSLHVDGEKSYVTNGGFAGLFTVLVRTPGLGGERAQSLVCVPANTPGVRIGPEEKKLGIRGSSTVAVSFEDVRVPLDHVLGAHGEGMNQASGLLAWGRTLMSAGCVGAARSALDATVAHVRVRRQFGGPIGNFAATRSHVAWMAARAYAMEALVSAVGESQAAGAPIELDSSIVKVFCSEGAFEVCDRAIQLHGALGFLEETGVPRILRDTRVTRIFEGANDVLLLRVGAAALAERPVRPAPESTTSKVRNGPSAQPVDALVQALARATQGVREGLGIGAVRHQLVLQRLARALICARAARAALEAGARDREGRRAPSTPQDEGLATFAAESLAEEGAVWLAQLDRADHDEQAARVVTDVMYAR